VALKTFDFHYDLSMDMRPAKGCLVFSENGEITEQSQGAEAFTMQASDIEETSVIVGVGCGLIRAKMKTGEERVLCRFSLAGLKPAGEFTKLVNFFILTGEAAIPEKVETPTCPKCGRSLMEGLSVCLFCYDKMGVIKRAGRLMRPYMKKIIIAELFMMVSSILYLCVPVFNRILIDDYLRVPQGTFQQIGILALGMLIARTVGEVIFVLSARVYNKESIHFSNVLRDMAYEKIQKLSLNALSKRTPGDLIRRVMEDTMNIREFICDNGRWVLEQGVMFIIVIAVLAFTDWKLTLLVLLPIPIAMFVISRFWKYIIIRYDRQWRKNSKAQSILHDIIKGIRTVKSFGNEKAEINKFAAATKELAVVSSGNEVMWSILFPLTIFFTGVGEYLVLYFGGVDILGGGMSIGTLTMFTMYIAYIYGPLRWMVSFPRWLADALTSMVKVFDILDEDPEIVEIEEPKNVPVSGSVVFDGVSFGYKSYEPVLKDIHIEIKPGEMIGIVGRSGAGKSTMINLLMRLYDPNLGKILINDTDIRDMSPEHLHLNIGVVFQDNFLFAGTIYDNIAFAKPGATAEEVIAAAKAANAHEFIMQTPDGYDSMIGENGHSISGGERQRLAIARAVIKNPDILILDEATSSLDVETEAAIQESLNRLVKGRTTIAIAHRLSTLKSADRLLVLDKGVVAEMGTHAELIKQKGIYYNLVMAQRQTSKIAESA